MKLKYPEALMLSLGLAWVFAAPSRIQSGLITGHALAAPTLIVNERNYSTDMNVLRARFNEDKGKVRLLLLLSPT